MGMKKDPGAAFLRVFVSRNGIIAEETNEYSSNCYSLKR
jgi:hypothetical protein